MSKQEVMGIAFIVGGLLGFLSLALSLAWHKLDRMMGDVEPVERRIEGDDDARMETFAEADAHWARLRNAREWVRVVGLVCLYLSLFAMGFSAVGLGVAMLEGK